MADYNNVTFIGKSSFPGKQGDGWYRNSMSVYQGKNKEGKSEYFNVSFFLKKDQFGFIESIEQGAKYCLSGLLKVEKYVDKDGENRLNLQVAFPEIDIIREDNSAPSEFDNNDVMDLYSDEPF